MTPRRIELDERHEDLPPVRRPAVRDAEERAAAAQHPARPAAERDVPGAAGRVVHGAGGPTFGVIGRNGSGKSTALKLVAGITKPTSGTVHGAGPHLRADRAGRGLPSGDLRPRERLHQRHHARADQARDPGALRRDRRVRRARRTSSTRRSRRTRPACTCVSASPSRFTWIPTSCWWTRCWRSATRASRTSASTSSPSSSGAARRSCSSRTRSAWSSASATRRCGSTPAGSAPRAIRSA